MTQTHQQQIAMYRTKEAGRNMISYYDKVNEHGNLIAAEPTASGSAAASTYAR